MSTQPLPRILTFAASTATIATAAMAPAAMAQTTLSVPSEYPTIQSAIDAAQDGDTVLVAAGLYAEAIDFRGKVIAVRSSSGARATTIDATGLSTSTVTFATSEGLGSTLDGFTITGGAGDGGGIRCVQSSPTIVNNIVSQNRAGLAANGGGLYCSGGAPHIEGNSFTQNQASVGGGLSFADGASPQVLRNLIANNDAAGGIGGGILCVDSPARIEQNRIIGNRADSQGGGIDASGAPVLILDNWITDNRAVQVGGGVRATGDGLALVNNVIAGNRSQFAWGGGIALVAGSAILTNNTVVANTAPIAGGGLSVSGQALVWNCISWGNAAAVGHEIDVISGMAHLGFSNVQASATSTTGNVVFGAGMLAADPLFVDEPGLDLHLRHDSPCRDVGAFEAPMLAAADLEGDPRPAGAAPDMGADEFYEHFYGHGATAPGSAVAARAIGPPGSTVVVALSAQPQLLSPPLALPGLGTWFLLPPVFTAPMPTIGATGVSEVVFTLSPTSVPGTRTPMQALVGLRLTNAWVLEVE